MISHILFISTSLFKYIDEFVHMEKTCQNEVANQGKKKCQYAGTDESQKLHKSFVFCILENKIFTCPISKENGACPSGGVCDGIGEVAEKRKRGKIGEHEDKKREDDPVYDGGAAADEKIHDQYLVFAEMQCIEHGVDDLIEKTDEKAAVILFLFDGFQKRSFLGSDSRLNFFQSVFKFFLGN